MDQSTKSIEKPDSSLQTDRRPSTVKEDGDDFPAAPNIASKIAQRRLPRRTPTSHVKGVSGDLIRRRLSKTNDEQGSSRPNRYTYESSFDKSIDEEDVKINEVPEKKVEVTTTNIETLAEPVKPEKSSQ
ncbi:unnamed protein product [Caenorhabditis brenneri]